MILDSEYDGVDAVLWIVSDDHPNPERKERKREFQDEYVVRVREEGDDWLPQKIERQREALQSIREQFHRVKRHAMQAADMKAPDDRERTVWPSDAPDVLIKHYEELHRRHSRAKERLEALEEVRDKIASDGLPEKITQDGRPRLSQEDVLCTLQIIIEKLDTDLEKSLTTDIFDEMDRNAENHLDAIRNRFPKINIPETNNTSEWRNVLPELKKELRRHQ